MVMNLRRALGVVSILFVVFLFASRYTVSSNAYGNTSQSLAPIRAGPDDYFANWRAGSIWPSSVAAESVVQVETEIKTPSTAPLSDELYGVIMSIWDYSGSYDQIGIADYYGTWELIYSYTTGSCTDPTSETTWNAMALSTNTKYLFTIFANNEVNGGTGGIYFQAFVGSTQVFSHYLNNGANYLDAGYEYTCSTNTSYVYYDYTDYEQVVYTATQGGAPNYNFKFTDNKYCFCISSAATVPDSWTTWTYPGAGGNVPSFVSVGISGSKVTIAN